MSSLFVVSRRSAQQASTFAFVAGVVVIAFCAIALAGWIAGIEALKSVLPGLPPMKANRKAQAPKRTRAPKSGKLLFNGKKSRAWAGFAPELCGVMSGPSDLSLREGFARG